MRALKKARGRIVALQAKREARVPAIICSAAGFKLVGVAAACRGLRLFGSAAKDPVQAGFPLFLPPRDLRAGAVGCNLDVFVLENRWRKYRGDVALDSKPFVCEIDHGSTDPHGAGVEN